jgi:crossover junction endodeoxyribonuclease RusA
MTRTFRLPWPPSVNTLYRCRTGSSKPYISKRGKQFFDEALEDIRRQLGDVPPIMGRVRVCVELTCPDRRARDIDNHGAKAVLDSIVKAGLIVDDEQVDDLRIIRLGVESPGCADVTITEIETPEKE